MQVPAVATILLTVCLLTINANSAKGKLAPVEASRDEISRAEVSSHSEDKKHNRNRNYDGVLSVNITVSDAPKLVGLLDELNNPEGTDATITCSIGSGIKQDLSYEWYKDDQRLNESISRKVQIEVSGYKDLSVLRIVNLEPSDAGLYSCVAKNRFGRDRISTRINVKVQLKWINRPPADIDISAGRSLHLPCEASGVPEPHTTWIKIDEETNRNQDNLGSEFRYSTVRPEQAGLYECRVTNGADEDLVARTKLHVLGKY